jgi:hypothetical protein
MEIGWIKGLQCRLISCGGANILMSAAGIFKATSPNVKASGTPSSNLLPDEAGHKNATLQITSGTNNTGIQECFLAGTLVLKRGILTIP